MNMRSAMIVDDSEPDQFLTKMTLQQYDDTIIIHQAYDGREALDMLTEMAELPDVIFLDINMPRMDGHEFLAAFEKIGKKAPVIVMLTSSDQEEDKRRTRAYSCVMDYFVKPLERKDIEKMVATISSDEFAKATG